MILSKRNIKTVTDLREQTIKILNSLQKRSEPFVVFHRSDPKAVLLSLEAYQKLADLLEDYLDEELALEIEKQPRKKGIPLGKATKELGIKSPKNV